MNILTVFAAVVLVGVFLVIVMIMYKKIKTGRCNSKADLSGKTTIVTGANTGIGYCTALDFATRNARVILACRDMEKAESACSKIKEETGNKNVFAKLVDLSSMKSVRTFSETILKEESRLDILVNNAGCLGLPKKMTEDGLESTFAINHFGPFLLTNLLLDLLKNSAPSRIINLSSLANKFGKIDFDNLRAEKSFRTVSAYTDSKLASILFTKELARRLEGTGVTANCLHPGTIKTQLLRNVPVIVRLSMYIFGRFLIKTPEEGAQTTIYCAVSEEVGGVTGQYFSECQNADKAANPISQDEGVAKKLWEISEKYTGLA